MIDPSHRPLSPHLQIYRPQLTSVMSILHRMAGGALALGTLALTWGLLAAAYGAGPWSVFTGFFVTPFGKFMLCGWSAALSYHLCNGVRHLAWDTGRLFRIERAYMAGYVVLIVAAALTIIMWKNIL